jgi:hypothetical protein
LTTTESRTELPDITIYIERLDAFMRIGPLERLELRK